MAKSQVTSFGTMLRELRKRTGFTQADLAVAAKVSERAISNIERGDARRPHPDTVLLLAKALGVEGPELDRLVLAAQRPTSGQRGGVPSMRTLPRDIRSFTGRDAELRKIAGTSGSAEIFVISGMPGVGKTAFATHAAHELGGLFPDGQLFLPLFGHTPDQRPVDPASALESLLLMIGLDGSQLPRTLEQRTALWRDRVAGSRFILVLDDAVGSDQVRPLLPGNAASLVLVTSRKQLSGLVDSRAIRLDELTPAQTAELIVSIADRPGLKADDDSVADIARMCAGLPLAAGIIGSLLRDHRGWTPGELAADMTAARGGLELMAAENLSVATAFQLSYRDLTRQQRQLFRRLALHPGTDFDAWAASALDGGSLDAARRNLAALRGQHLLAEPVRGRYRFHDLIREYALAQADEEPAAERAAAVGRLLDYYLHSARRADLYLARRTPPGWRAPAGAAPLYAPALPTRGRATTWMQAERGNLRAVAEYASRHGELDYAFAISTAMAGFLRVSGYWDQAAAMCQLSLAVACELADPLAEAGALTDLADMQRVTRDYAEATMHVTRARELCRAAGDGVGEAGALTCLSVLRYMTGDYPAAVDALAEALELLRASPDRLAEANARHHLGVVQRVRSDFPASMASLRASLELHQSLHNKLGVATALCELGQTQYLADDVVDSVITLDLALQEYLALGERLGEANTRQYLGAVQMDTGDLAAAAGNLSRALELHEGLGHAHGRANALVVLGAVRQRSGDYDAASASLHLALDLYLEVGNQWGEANALIQLGVVQLAIGDHEAAETGLHHALRICRKLGNRMDEASALCHLGEVQHAKGDFVAAASSLDEALDISREIENGLGEAEALNSIGWLLLTLGQPTRAESAHQRAHALSIEFHSPGEQARALEGIGHCHRRTGRPVEGLTSLRQALAIYERIGWPDSTRVAEALRNATMNGQ
jgi:tetratricopeptide (TPR) repeat protein/transcriptional regulator with XRE-family HTH domain